MLVGIAFLTVVALVCYSFVTLLAVTGRVGKESQRGVLLLWGLGTVSTAVFNWGVPL